MFCIALSDVKKTALNIFQDSIKKDMEDLLVAFYGDNYKEILAKGRISGNNEVWNVLNALERIENDLGIKFAKGENL